MATYYVGPSGDDDPSAGTSYGTPWATLQYAADSVSAGDVVKVLPGEYARVDISNGGNASGGVITFEAYDQNDRPYIRTAYYNIPDTQDGSTDRTKAGIRLTKGHVKIDGFRFTNERAISIAIQLSGANTSDITVANCLFDDVRAIRDLDAPATDTDTDATGPIWIAHSGQGYENKNIHFHDLEFVDCSARRPIDGRGTEIVTFFGAHNGILVEDCSWDNCNGINLNFVGIDGRWGTLGQPRNIVVRRCLFVGGYRTNDGIQASMNVLYFDKATGPVEVYENIIVNPATMGSLKISFEKSDDADLLLPPQRMVIRDNVVVTGQLSVIMGTNNESNEIQAGRAYHTQDVGIAHNVFATSTYTSANAALRVASCRNISITNNVLTSYAGKNVIGSSGLKSAADTASLVARGNIVWTSKSGNSVVWGTDGSMTAAEFVADIQDGFGWTNKPVFFGGITAIKASDDLSGYTLDDWTLVAGSPGYKDALPLAYAQGGGSSKNTIKVSDVRFFAPGIPGLGVAGTSIMVDGSEAVVTLVDYTARTLTLDRNLSWSDLAEIRYKPTTADVYSVGITSAASQDAEKPDDEDPPPDPENLVANPSFDDGEAAWDFSAGDGAGTFSVASGAGTVTVTTGSATTQLYQYDIPIVSGRDYVLSVFGKTDSAPEDVTVKLISHTTFVSLGLNDTITLGADCTEHRLTFTATATTANGRLQFLFPTAHEVTIYGVYLGTAVSIDPMCPEPTPGGGAPVTQTLQVAASLDDWGDNSGTFFGTTSTILAAGGDKDASRYDYRLLFRVQIAETIATTDAIDSASIEYYKAGSDTGAGLPTVRIWAEASVNTSQPASSAASKALTLTTAYVDYTIPDTTQEWKTITGIGPIIEELLTIGTLTAGNYITIVMGTSATGWGGTNTMQYIRSFDYGDNTYGPKLTISSAAPSINGSATIDGVASISSSAKLRAKASATIASAAEVTAATPTLSVGASALIAGQLTFTNADPRGPSPLSATIEVQSALAASPMMAYAAQATIAGVLDFRRAVSPTVYASATIAASSTLSAVVYYNIAMGGEGAIAHYRTAGATSTRSTDREKRSGIATKRYRP